MAKLVFFAVLFSIIAGILQSTLLSHISLNGAVPDLALGILVFTAYVNGSMPGQLSGFFSGLLLDFFSAAPLGLNCIVRTLTGALAGMLKGSFFLDFFLLPMILCAVATLFKAFVIFLLHLAFPGTVPAYSLTTPVFWSEFALNALSAPFLFALLRRFRPLLALKDK